MKRKRKVLIISFLPILFLLFLGGLSYNPVQQKKLDKELIEAIKAGDTPKALRCLAQGANPNTRDEPPRDAHRHRKTSEKSGRSVLPLSIREGKNDITKELVKRGADVNCDNGDPLIAAINYHNLEIVKLLADKGANVNARYENDFTPLHVAVMMVLPEDIESVRTLLKHGAKVNVPSKEGYTPLILAMKRGDNYKTVQLLITYGADVNAKSPQGNTPLKAATIYHQKDTIRVLKEAGAKE